MSTNSSIEWTATEHPDGTVTPGSTWNPVRGCTTVSPGCAHCYAEVFAERFRGVKGHPYEQGFDLRLVPEKLTEPLSWKKPRRVFVNSMSDLFQEGVPDKFIDRVFAVMALARPHTFQILTKRAERMREYFSIQEDALLERWAAASMEQPLPLDAISRDNLRDGSDRDEEETYTAERAWSEIRNGDFPLPNVWLGVSVENQHFADERIPLLLRTPAAIRFISAEPLLGPVDLAFWLQPSGPEEASSGTYLDWVIAGGESGSKARPFDLAWARSIVQQCADAGVACFVKQLGAKPHDGRLRFYLDKKGGDPSEWPVDLRVRQFPPVPA